MSDPLDEFELSADQEGEEDLGVPDTSDPSDPLDEFELSAGQEEPEPSEATINTGDPGQGAQDLVMQGMEYGLDKLSKGLDYIDQYGGGASTRKGAGAFLNEEELSTIPGQMAEQYGADPSTPAPSGYELNKKAGVPTEMEMGNINIPVMGGGETPDFLNKLSPEWFPKGSNGGRQQIPSMKANPAAILAPVTEAGLDPTTLFPVGLVGKTIAHTAGLSSKLLKYLANVSTKKAAPFVGKLLGNIDEAKTTRYLNDPKGLNKADAIPNEDLQVQMENARYEFQTQPIDDLTSYLQDSKDTLKGLLDDKKYSLKDKVTDEGMAKNLSVSLGEEKKKLGDMSQEADIILSNAFLEFDKKHLLKIIDDVAATRGNPKRIYDNNILVGEKATEAFKKLMALKTRISEGLPDKIDGPQLRQILGEIRDDIDFKQDSGEFNELLNLMRKKLGHRMSEALKDPKTGSPEYAAYMKHMAEITDDLGELNKHFGTHDKSFQSLGKISAGGDAAVLKRKALDKFAQGPGREDLAKYLKGVDEDRRVNDLITRNKHEAGAELYPSEATELEVLKHSLGEAKRGREATLGSEGTDTLQSNISKMKSAPEGRESIAFTRATNQLSDDVNRTPRGQHTISTPAQKAQIGPHEKVDFLKTIKDKGAVEAFDKDATRGSRFTAAGASLGYFLGGAPTSAALGTVGFAMDKFVGRMMKYGMDKSVAVQDVLGGISLKLQSKGPFSLKYGSTLEKAFDRGGNALVVTHHTLMNRDPEYRALFEGEE